MSSESLAIYAKISNLNHVTSQTIMAQTKDLDLPPSDEAIDSFEENQCRLLSSCPINLDIQPGGSQFEPAINVDLAADEQNPWDFGRSRRPLELTISTPREEHLVGEPVIVDVALTINAEGGAAGRSLPRRNELDPGYDRFQIWVETPLGERYRHRPLFRYCAGAAADAPTTGWTNNVNLSRSARGVEFTRPGLYRVTAVYVVGGRRRARIESEPITILVRLPGSRTEREIAEGFTASHVAGALYYRGRGLDGATRESMTALVTKHPNAAELELMRYVLGRRHLELAQRRLNKGGGSAHKNQAVKWLALVTGRKLLGVASGETAKRLLKEAQAL